jgi:hypothetical protein
MGFYERCQLAAITRDKKIQQEANLKFTVKMKKIATETFNLLRKVYADDSRVT